MDCFGQQVDGEIDVFLRVEASDPETEAGPGQIIAQTEGSENMARLGIRRGAGTSAGNAQVSHAHHQRLAVNIGETTAQISGEAQDAVA